MRTNEHTGEYGTCFKIISLKTEGNRDRNRILSILSRFSFFLRSFWVCFGTSGSYIQYIFLSFLNNTHAFSESEIRKRKRGSHMWYCLTDHLGSFQPCLKSAEPSKRRKASLCYSLVASMPCSLRNGYQQKMTAKSPCSPL